MATEKCIRCGRAAPTAAGAERGKWERDEDGYPICPGCLSGEESRWIAEEVEENAHQAAEAEAREQPDEGA
jgi:hypothetical protein